MKSSKQILSLLVIPFFLISCGQKSKFSVGETVSLGFQDDGKVSQKSEKKEEQRRIYFSYSFGSGENRSTFEGSKKVESFKKVNESSLLEEQKSKYYAVGFADSEDNIIAKGLLAKDFYKKTFDKNSEYKITNYRGTFFIDLKESEELKSVSKFIMQDPESDEVIEVGEIDDLSKDYIEPQKEEGWNGELFTYRIHGSANPENAFDFVVLTEGFTKEELKAESKESLMNSQFGEYLQAYVLPLLDTEPYKSRKDKINLWVVATPSLDSGVSKPQEGIELKTVYRTIFGAHCSDRSLVVRDQTRALEMASETPFDQVIVLVNDKTYGGQGSNIATFSVHERAPYLIKHEIAHAVGMMADEYKYHSDEVTHETCEDNLLESYVKSIFKKWGTNSYFEEESKLAPNLTNITEPESVKWKDFLTETSPIVYFNYPKDGLTFDSERFSYKAQYESHFDRESMLLTMGTTSFLNSLINIFKEVIVNGVAHDFFRYKIGEQLFIEIPSVKLQKGEVIDLEVRFVDEPELRVYEDYMKHYSNSYHTLTMPSEDFSGGSKEVGIFQGAVVDLYKTYRSSYNNIMTSNSTEFDPWQEHIYGSLIDKYLK